MILHSRYSRPWIGVTDRLTEHVSTINKLNGQPIYLRTHLFTYLFIQIDRREVWGNFRREGYEKGWVRPKIEWRGDFNKKVTKGHWGNNGLGHRNGKDTTNYLEGTLKETMTKDSVMSLYQEESVKTGKEPVKVTEEKKVS